MHQVNSSHTHKHKRDMQGEKYYFKMCEVSIQMEHSKFGMDLSGKFESWKQASQKSSISRSNFGCLIRTLIRTFEEVQKNHLRTSVASIDNKAWRKKNIKRSTKKLTKLQTNWNKKKMCNCIKYSKYSKFFFYLIVVVVVDIVCTINRGQSIRTKFLNAWNEKKKDHERAFENGFTILSFEVTPILFISG